MSTNTSLPVTRRVGKVLATLALSAGIATAVTAVAPTTAQAATCKPTNLDGNWYSTDPDAYITRISVENLSCATGGTGFAVRTWAHHWLGPQPGETYWGTTTNVRVSGYGFVNAVYVVPDAWTTTLGMIPDYDGETLYVSQTDDYVQPGVENHVWERQTFVH